MNSRLSNEIKAEAKRLGFFCCGIAKAEPVDDDAARRLMNWLNHKGEADMDYMRRNTDKRLNPLLLMPQARSIISVALNYAPHDSFPKGEYRLAAYAIGQDYHEIMKAKLHTLAHHFGLEDALYSKREHGLYRAFSDTGPVLERYWAQKAGLGWTGRNHQLIIPHAGSMFFLGELFVDIDLDYDKPMTPRCGTCHACLDQCPTGAIYLDKDGVPAFDAMRCLSYQLIENRNGLSEEAKEHMGDCIYGCDRCQQACPWNRFATPNDEPQLQPKEQLMKMSRADWQNLSLEQYQRLFKGSAVKRAKYAGLMRNIKAAEENESDTRQNNTIKDEDNKTGN